MNIRAVIPFLLRSGACLALFGGVVSVRAQTVAGYTQNTSWAGMKVNSSTFLSDLYDGATGLDPSKQNQLNGSNRIWDLVGDQTSPLFRVSQGTTSSGAAYAFSVRLADWQSGGLKQGAVGLLIQDTGGFFGYGLQFAANGGLSVFRITPTTTNLTAASFTFNFSTISAGASTVLYSYEVATGTPLSAGSDAWLTFVISQSELNSFRGTTWAYNANIGASAFTSSSALNGQINADFPGSGGTITFASESGTVVPEFPTAILLGAMTLPLAGLVFWRRRRAAQTKQAA